MVAPEPSNTTNVAFERNATELLTLTTLAARALLRHQLFREHFRDSDLETRVNRHEVVGSKRWLAITNVASEVIAALNSAGYIIKKKGRSQ